MIRPRASSSNNAANNETIKADFVILVRLDVNLAKLGQLIARYTKKN